MYELNYGTGAGNSYHETVKEAMEAVEPTYTQLSISIVDEDGNELYALPWWGVAHDIESDGEPPHTDYGKNGYYGQWRNVETGEIVSIVVQSYE